MPNNKNEYMWTYRPNAGSALALPDAANLAITAVTYDNAKKNFLPSQAFTGTAPSVKVLKWGLTADRRLKPRGFSAAVSLASGTLDSTELLRLTIASTDGADKPIAYQPFIDLAGTDGPYYALPLVPVPQKFSRENIAMNENLVIDICSLPPFPLKDEFYINALASDSAAVYGVQSDYLDFGFADDGHGVDMNVESYSFNTNGSPTTVPYTAQISKKLSLMPNNFDRKRKILPYLGFVAINDNLYSYGIPHEGLKSMIIDYDGDYNEGMSQAGRERNIIWSLGTRPTDTASLSQKINGKDPIELTLNDLETNFANALFKQVTVYEAA